MEFIKSHIYRRLEESTALHPNGLIEGEPCIGHINRGDEFLVLDMEDRPRQTGCFAVHVLGCTREFMGWGVLEPSWHEEVTEEP